MKMEGFAVLVAMLASLFLLSTTTSAASTTVLPIKRQSEASNDRLYQLFKRAGSSDQDWAPHSSSEDASSDVSLSSYTSHTANSDNWLPSHPGHSASSSLMSNSSPQDSLRHRQLKRWEELKELVRKGDLFRLHLRCFDDLKWGRRERSRWCTKADLSSTQSDCASPYCMSSELDLLSPLVPESPPGPTSPLNTSYKKPSMMPPTRMAALQAKVGISEYGTKFTDPMECIKGNTPPVSLFRPSDEDDASSEGVSNTRAPVSLAAGPSRIPPQKRRKTNAGIQSRKLFLDEYKSFLSRPSAPSMSPTPSQQDDLPIADHKRFHRPKNREAEHARYLNRSTVDARRPRRYIAANKLHLQLGGTSSRRAPQGYEGKRSSNSKPATPLPKKYDLEYGTLKNAQRRLERAAKGAQKTVANEEVGNRSRFELWTRKDTEWWKGFIEARNSTKSGCTLFHCIERTAWYVDIIERCIKQLGGYEAKDELFRNRKRWRALRKRQRSLARARRGGTDASSSM